MKKVTLYISLGLLATTATSTPSAFANNAYSVANPGITCTLLDYSNGRTTNDRGAWGDWLLNRGTAADLAICPIINISISGGFGSNSGYPWLTSITMTNQSGSAQRSSCSICATSYYGSPSIQSCVSAESYTTYPGTAGSANALAKWEWGTYPGAYRSFNKILSEIQCNIPAGEAITGYGMQF